jgi:hypothetical protein
LNERSFRMKSEVCEKFCPYYKPAKDESLACLGYLVIEKLIGKGINISCEKRERPLDPAVSGRLSRDLCVKCPFYDNDCDFAMVYRSNREGKPASSILPKDGEGQLLEKGRIPSPCGGFTLLGYLLGENIIDIDGIKKLI